MFSKDQSFLFEVHVDFTFVVAFLIYGCVFGLPHVFSLSCVCLCHYSPTTSDLTADFVLGH